MNNNMEDRLIRLEENLAFQERLAEGLHTALLEQQKQIKLLESALRGQNSRLLELEAVIAEVCGGLPVSSAKSGPPAEKPPHYR
ncbi:MAG: SlyX family protein [Deltaproteobacteria bacterium]|jgi:uncharacterized coiled-coil protein SlyX|nr:SlyX family protein [Deltaproteobacteria bacterium]